MSARRRPLARRLLFALTPALVLLSGLEVSLCVTGFDEPPELRPKHLAKAAQVKSSHVTSSQVTSQVKSSHAKSRQVTSSQVK